VREFLLVVVFSVVHDEIFPQIATQTVAKTAVLIVSELVLSW